MWFALSFLAVAVGFAPTGLRSAAPSSGASWSLEGGARGSAASRGGAWVLRGSASGAVGDVENPFVIVREDLKQMKQRIKELVERTLDNKGSEGGGGSSGGSSHPLLQEAAREFFERRERAFRPAVVLLVARAVEGTEAGAQVPGKQCLLAEIVEMMCTAQIVHDSVLEDDESGASGNVAHRTYSQNAGNKVSVLAGDFLLARCSVALSMLGDLTVVELMATALESMVQGGVLKAQASQAGLDDLLDLDHYVRRVTLKTSSLIADACRSAAILAGEPHDGEVAEAVYGYAQNLGLSYQIMFDTIAYSAALDAHHDDGGGDKGAAAPRLADHVSAPPIILAAAHDPEHGKLKAACATTLETSNDLRAVADDVESNGGLSGAKQLSKHYSNRAKAALAPLPDSPEKAALFMMADFVAQDDQTGLQREKYIAANAKKRRAAARAAA